MRFSFAPLVCLVFVALAPPTSAESFVVDKKTGLTCTPPPNAVANFRLNRRDKAKHNCVKHPFRDGYWAMLNAYRSGGKALTHWKGVSDANDPQCLVDWTYYGKDGNWVVERVKGRTTRRGDKHNVSWCALAVAQVKKRGTTNQDPAGVEDKQWAFCNCTLP